MKIFNVIRVALVFVAGGGIIFFIRALFTKEEVNPVISSFIGLVGAVLLVMAIFGVIRNRRKRSRQSK